MTTVVCGQDSNRKPREVLTDADGKVVVVVDNPADITIGTVAQGNPQADGTKAWPVRLFNATGALLGRLAAAASLPVVLSTEDLAALASCGPPTTSTAVTPSDSTDLSALATKGIWVGGAGDLSVKLLSDSSAVSILAVPAGTYIPGSFKRVMAATTATSIVAFS